jgi:hypothetical protein
MTDFNYDITVPQAFRNFPRHCGFHDPKRPGGIDVDRPERELAAFLQAWLFFGLASELVGHAIEPMYFVRTSCVHGSNTIVIDPRLDNRLEELLLDRYRLLINFQNAKANAVIEDIKRKVSMAQEYLTTFEQVAAPAKSTLSHVTLSVRLLLSFATWTTKVGSRIAVCAINRYATDSSYSYTLADYDSHFPSLENIKLARLNNISQRAISRHDLSAQLLTYRMRDNGWCPQRIKSALGAALGYPVLYYISSTRRRTSPLINHQHCSEDGCVASTLLGNQLRPSHILKGCTCLDIKPPILKIAHIIQTGGIPLVRIRRIPMGQIEIDVIPCTPSSRYVAISHVWSDGQLGSTQNALPQCRLGNLGQLIAGLPRSSGPGLRLFFSLHNSIHNLLWRCKLARYPSNYEGLFWLDTLCIPTGEGYENLRKTAINMMDLVYSGADRVLVLDSGLQQVSGGCEEITVFGDGYFSSNSNLCGVQVPEYARLLEVLAHVYSCNWMGRAWTFQEGFLSRDSVLQLRDSSIMFSLMDFRVYKSFHVMSPSFKLCKGSRITVPFLYPLRALKSLFGEDANKNIARRILDIVCTGFLVLFSSVLMPLNILFGCQWGTGAITCFVPQPLVNSHPETLQEFMCDVLRHAIHGQDVTMSSNDRIFFEFKDFQELQFISTWNSLLGRSTTKPEDLPTIVANMTGFNAADISQSDDAGDRMRSIIFSFNLLPMDLLFIKGSKYGGGSNHTDRWIPRAPCDEPFRLMSNEQMRYTSQGFILDVGYNKGKSVFMLDKLTQRAQHFYLTTIPTTMCLSPFADSRPYRIEALIPDNDKLPEKSEGETCLILDCNDQDDTACIDESEIIRGARMLVVKKLDNKVYLKYDCAIRATRGNSLPSPYPRLSAAARPSSSIGFNIDADSGWPIFHAKRVPIEMTLILQHSMCHPFRCSTSCTIRL